MRVFANPVGSGSLWFDNLTTADGTPVAYDPQARAFVPMPPFCINRDIIGCNWIAPEEGAFLPLLCHDGFGTRPGTSQCDTQLGENRSGQTLGAR